jgi:hypothetical protein
MDFDWQAATQTKDAYRRKLAAAKKKLLSK